MDIIDLMIKEHDNVLSLISIIRNACCQVLEGKELPIADFKDFITVAKVYADGHHHKKEEQILFREMLNEMGDMAVNIIKNGMIVEHEMGRYRIMELERTLNDFANEPNTMNKLFVITNAVSWADLLEHHIQRENNVVYPLARRSLKKETLQLVASESMAFEEDEKEKEKRDMALSLLKNLQEKY